MKLIIDIPKKVYKNIQSRSVEIQAEGYTVENAVLNGTPIPNSATNGDVIKAMFDVKEVNMCNTYGVHFPEEGEDYGHYFFKDWWNSPYKKKGGGKE